MNPVIHLKLLGNQTHLKHIGCQYDLEVHVTRMGGPEIFYNIVTWPYKSPINHTVRVSSSTF